MIWGGGEVIWGGGGGEKGGDGRREGRREGDGGIHELQALHLLSAGQCNSAHYHCICSCIAKLVITPLYIAWCR